MRIRIRFVLAALTIPVVGCDSSTSPGSDTITREFQFTSAAPGWEAGFADFPVDAEGEEAMELVAGHQPLPEGLDLDGSGLRLAGTNRGEGAFLFWKAHVDDLAAGLRYRVRFEVELASAAPSGGCPDDGVAPGSEVFVKVGVSEEEPDVRTGEVDGVERHLFTLDKGPPDQAGEESVLLGDITSEESTCSDPEWALLTLGSDERLEVEADAGGGAWIWVGVDSAHQGRADVYLTRYRLVFESI